MKSNQEIIDEMAKNWIPMPEHFNECYSYVLDLFNIRFPSCNTVYSPQQADEYFESIKTFWKENHMELEDVYQYRIKMFGPPSRGVIIEM